MGLSENGESTNGKWNEETTIPIVGPSIQCITSINTMAIFDIPPMVLSISIIHDNQYRSWIADN